MLLIAKTLLTSLATVLVLMGIAFARRRRLERELANLKDEPRPPRPTSATATYRTAFPQPSPEDRQAQIEAMIGRLVRYEHGSRTALKAFACAIALTGLASLLGSGYERWLRPHAVSLTVISRTWECETSYVTTEMVTTIVSWSAVGKVQVPIYGNVAREVLVPIGPATHGEGSELRCPAPPNNSQPTRTTERRFLETRIESSGESGPRGRMLRLTVSRRDFERIGPGAMIVMRHNGHSLPLPPETYALPEGP